MKVSPLFTVYGSSNYPLSDKLFQIPLTKINNIWEEVLFPVLDLKYKTNEHLPFLERYMDYHAKDIDEKIWHKIQNSRYFFMKPLKDWIETLYNCARALKLIEKDISWILNLKIDGFNNREKAQLFKKVIRAHMFFYPLENIKKLFENKAYKKWITKTYCSQLMIDNMDNWEKIEYLIKKGGTLQYKKHFAIMRVIFLSNFTDVKLEEFIVTCLYNNYLNPETLLKDINHHYNKSYKKTKLKLVGSEYEDLIKKALNKYYLRSRLDNDLNNKNNIEIVKERIKI